MADCIVQSAEYRCFYGTDLADWQIQTSKRAKVHKVHLCNHNPVMLGDVYVLAIAILSLCRMPGRRTRTAKSSHCQFFCHAHAFTSFCWAHDDCMYVQYGWMGPGCIVHILCQKAKLASGWLCQKSKLANKELMLCSTPVIQNPHTSKRYNLLIAFSTLYIILSFHLSFSPSRSLSITPSLHLHPLLKLLDTLPTYYM